MRPRRIYRTPTTVDLEITDICNEKCVYCFNFDRDLSMGTLKLDKEKIDHLVRQFVNFEVFHVISSGGEAFANFEMLLYLNKKLKENNISTSVNSNLSIKAQRKERLKRLFDSGCDHILTSLPSYLPDVTNKLVNSKNAFDRITSGIKDAVEIGFRISANMVVHNSNKNQVYLTAKLASELGCQRIFATRIVGPDYETEVDYENTNELVKNWTVMQDYINLNNKLNFLKTHNAFCTINGNPFTNKTNTLAAIYVVRDPRDVLISFSSHFNLNPNKTLEIMKSDEFWETESKYNNFRSSLFGSWKSNYKSWVANKVLDTIVIRYEDLMSKPFESFSKIIKFLEDKANVIYDEKSINFSINQTNFQRLHELEKKSGFNEATNNTFFRKGSTKQWADLDKKLIANLKENFGDVMKELNYN